MKNVFTNLLKIKSIITIVVLAVFVYCVIRGVLQPDNIMVIISMVITFYFAKQGGGSNDS